MLPLTSTGTTTRVDIFTHSQLSISSDTSPHKAPSPCSSVPAIQHFEHKDSALPNELEKLTSTGDVEPDPEQPSPLPDAHTPVKEEPASVPPETDTPHVSYCRPNPIPQYWGAGGPLSRYSTTPYNLLGSRSPFVQSSGFPLGGSVFGPQPTYGSEYVPTLETTYNAPFYPQSSPFALPLPPLMPPFPSASISPTGKRDRNASRLRTKIELAKDKPELKIPDLDTFVRIGHIVEKDSGLNPIFPQQLTPFASPWISPLPPFTGLMDSGSIMSTNAPPVQDD